MIYFKRTKKPLWIIFAVLFCLNLIVWGVIYDFNKFKGFEVIFFNVGQGDAIFIETPQKHQILIDGGPDLTILEKLGKEMPFYDRSLDLIILSHPERDHLFGLLEVLKRYKVENILWTGVVRDIAEYKEWKKLIIEEEAKIFIAQIGQKIIFHSQEQCNSDELNSRNYLDILFPFENLENQEFKNSNDTSIVSRLVFGDVSFLFTGDIAKGVEQKLIGQGIYLDSDILKVAHHGSKTSTSYEFLKTVSPEVAVIQVGKNNYSHPHPEVLARLEEFGIDVLRTDKNGDIKIMTDGNTLRITNITELRMK